MLTNWPLGKSKKDINFRDVEKLIKIISEIRSFKSELNVSPGSYIDISIEKIKNKDKSFFIDNEIVLKKLGRINNFYSKDQEKQSATLMISGDIFKLYFDQSVDLNTIKDNLLKRQNKHQIEIEKISRKLSNKAFVNKAPKNIVDQEKTNYSNIKNDIKKITLALESL